MSETVTSMSAACGSVLLLPSMWSVIGSERSCLAVGSVILAGSPSMSSFTSAVKDGGVDALHGLLTLVDDLLRCQLGDRGGGAARLGGRARALVVAASGREHDRERQSQDQDGPQ